MAWMILKKKKDSDSRTGLEEVVISLVTYILMCLRHLSDLVTVSNTFNAVGNSDCIKYACLANCNKLEKS